MTLKTITEPTSEPISIAECRSHLHWDLDGDLASETDVDEAENALILDKLGAAREYAEGVTGLFLAPRTVEFALDSFPCTSFVALEGSPVRLVDSIEYVDTDGAAQTLDSAAYLLNDYVTPPRVQLVFGETWPAVRCGPLAVKVRYVVGYGEIPETPPDVLVLPKDIKAGLLLTMAHLLENKEDSAPIALESIPTGALALLRLKRVDMGV